jgi:hypothetical protein
MLRDVDDSAEGANWPKPDYSHKRPRGQLTRESGGKNRLRQCRAPGVVGTPRGHGDAAESAGERVHTHYEGCGTAVHSHR